MGEQKNLFLAIGISIAIILLFQLLFPQPTPIKQSSVETNQSKPTATIDDHQTEKEFAIKSINEIINDDERVLIETPALKGSINLNGGIIDDLTLSNYNETLEENSNNIRLLHPEDTKNPYYIELGWKTLTNDSMLDLPDLNTKWNKTSSLLNENSKVSLFWTNNQNITFKIHYSIDENYLFDITQEIENNSTTTIEVFPYRLVKRINFPEMHQECISDMSEHVRGPP